MAVRPATASGDGGDFPTIVPPLFSQVSDSGAVVGKSPPILPPSGQKRRSSPISTVLFQRHATTFTVRFRYDPGRDAPNAK
jgi:hypothetical protein